MLSNNNYEIKTLHAVRTVFAIAVRDPLIAPQVLGLLQFLYRLLRELRSVTHILKQGLSLATVVQVVKSTAIAGGPS